MAVSTFPLVSGAQLTTVLTAAQGGATKMEPGTICAVRSNTDCWSLIQWVQLDNNGCSQGDSLVLNFATLKSYSVKAAATASDGFQPNFVGIAAATIASQSFGFMYIHGYVEKADLSKTSASGELLAISASTAGKLTPIRASSFWNATIGTVTNATLPWPVAMSRTTIATGVGSVTIVGTWGV